MKHVKKSVLLWYSPREMYDLVADVRAYPQFLPWCQRAEVLQEDAEAVTAKLSLAYAGVKQSFTTRNLQRPGQQLTMTLVDGPFSVLDGIWDFIGIDLGSRGGAASEEAEAKACRVEFALRYAFASGPLELVVSPVFDRIANTFVDAFVVRAEQVYGKR
jgi:ribosome-associated toxin RatA of RatAB toxin-antitoxin module